MEWVETTGRTVEEAKDAALDQLGVDEADAEFELLEEPKAGLFGRMRREARVRARVRPTQPRPKAERRDRRRRGGAPTKDKAGGGRGQASTGADDEVTTEDSGPAAEAERPREAKGGSSGSRARGRGGRGRGGSGGAASPAKEQTEGARTGPEGGSDVSTEISVEEQGEIVADFVDGLVGAFDLDGEITTVAIDEDTVEVRVEGDDLGLLIGPKGQTLAAIQDLSRTVVQRRADGGSRGRVRLDVSGYRQRRKEALERFVHTVAEEVKSTGVQKVLEPMSPPDRKIVHDTANTIDGVSTSSEGEEPRRRVVITPGS